VFDLAKALGSHDRVEVLAPHAAGAARTEEWDGVTINRFRYFIPTRLQRLAYGGGMRENMRASWLARLQVPFLLFAQVWALRRRVRGGAISAINTHWMVPQGLTAALVRGRARQFRHVLHVHAADVYLLEKVPFGAQIARFVLRRTDAVLADGSHVRDALDSLAGYPSGAVLQPMGAWVADFGDVANPVVSRFPDGYLVAVGRLVEKKGFVHLLRAFARLRDEFPGLGLIVIGSGPLQISLEEEARVLRLGESVDFVGAKPHDEVVRYLHGGRVAVVPSVIDSHGETEGMPTVVVETMAAGLPVVGSDVAGIPDVIDHTRNGWLARPADPVDLADQIRTALTVDTEAVVGAARRTAAEHDWPAVACRYLGYLRPPLAAQPEGRS
jgi:glycosyltransferase involved in cell wall biosynthesis